MNQQSLSLRKMDSSETQAKIAKAIKVLEGYIQMGGSMVTDAIADFKLIGEAIGDSENPDLSSVEDKIRALNNLIGPYKSMVPEVGAALDAITGYLE
jgi:hypothetical protein